MLCCVVGFAEATVDLDAHDFAFGRGMVVSAQQRSGEVFASPLKSGDLLVEEREPPRGDGLPCSDVGRVENAFDVIQGEARVLEHADEHESPQRLVAVPALS